MVFANRTRINIRGYRFWKRATTHNSRAVSHLWCCLYTGGQYRYTERGGGGGNDTTEGCNKAYSVHTSNVLLFNDSFNCRGYIASNKVRI
jgi:hypothetical protein